MLLLPSRSSELDLLDVGTTCSVMGGLSPHPLRAWFGSALPSVIAVSFEHCLAEPSTGTRSGGSENGIELGLSPPS